MFFLDQLINGLSLGALYALIAVGYTVVYGIVQLINFAHGEIFMIGGFASVGTWLLIGKAGNNLSWWMMPIMIVGGVVVAVATAVLMERVAYRPLRHAPRLAPLITAIGISVFLQELVPPCSPWSPWPCAGCSCGGSSTVRRPAGACSPRRRTRTPPG